MRTVSIYFTPVKVRDSNRLFEFIELKILVASGAISPTPTAGGIMTFIRSSRITILLLSLLFLLASPAYPTRIVSLSTCESISDSGIIPERITDQFTKAAPEIHAVLVLDEVKAGLEIKGIWVSVDAIEVPNYQIDSAIVKIKDKETRVHFALSRPTSGWPLGKYRLDVYFDDIFVTSAPFSVSQKASAKKETAPVRTAKKSPTADLLGRWVCQTQYGPSYLEFKSENSLVLDGEPFTYSVSGSTLRIKEEAGTNDYPFTLKDGTLTIKFTEGYSMAYTRTDDVPPGGIEQDEPDDQEEPVQSQPDIAGSSDLMQHFAGTWWNATTNTETEVTLTADGRYYESSSASYSGSSSDQYGNQDMSYGSASDNNVQGTWTARGNKQEGEIVITYQNGNQRVIPYRVHVENGEVYWSEYYFNGVLYGKK
jgi:hypothetical protein